MDWAPEDLSKEQRQEMVDYYKRHMIYGALWFIGGSLITVISLTNGNGGVITYGAIIYGIYDFFRGLNGWMTYR